MTARIGVCAWCGELVAMSDIEEGEAVELTAVKTRLHVACPAMPTVSPEEKPAGPDGGG